MLRQNTCQYVLFFLSLPLYFLIGYKIQRQETVPLFLIYFSLFLLYVLIIRKNTHINDDSLKFWIIAAVIFRLMLLFSVPALSDDFYRFIWDGRLLAAGYHPFAEVPSYYMSQSLSIPGIDQGLFNKLNSKQTFTIYPSVAQFIFWLSVKLSTGTVYSSIVVMKVIIFLFEIGTLWMMTKVLLRFNIARANTLLYALNPLVILELTGNLHFEGVMVFFLLTAVFYLTRQQLSVSSLAFALSICTKLIPLLFLPLLLRYLGWKKTLIYWTLTGAITLLLFLPLLNTEIIRGLTTSLGYYFQRFEFNASLYYLIREIGYLIAGFNIIQFAAPLLAIAAASIIFYLAFRNLPSSFTGNIDASVFKSMVWSMFIYLLSAAILHPWYIITLLVISLMTPFRFPLVWTGVIFLSYAGYTQTEFEENLLLVAIEYIIMIAYLLYETVWNKRQNHS